MSELKVASIKGLNASSAAISIDNSSGTCTANITNNLSNRNLIINGAMQVAQRGTSATITTTEKYVVDRFFAANVISSAVQTATQENDAPEGFYKSLKVTCTTADTDYSTNNQSKVEHRIEGTDIQRLNFGTANAKTLGVSFYVKSNKTGNSAIALVNSANDRSFVHQFTIASANTWQRVSFTVAGDTSGTWLVDTNIGMRLRWGTFGTDFQTSTLDAWQAGQKMTTSNSPINFNAAINDFLQITGVQVEIGSVTDFEHRSIGLEYNLCRRYFYKFQPSTTFVSFGVGTVYSSTQAVAHVNFPVPLRASPTFSYNGATNNFYDVSGNLTNFSAIIVNQIMGTSLTGYSSCKVNVTGSGTAGKVFMFASFNSNVVFLQFDSEL